MTQSLAFASAIGASMIWLQGCGSSDSPAPAPPGFDCTQAYRQQCFDVMPFKTCCHDCGGGSGGQTCEVKQSHSLQDGTELDLALTFTYDIGDENCSSACATLKDAHWNDFCDGCDNCVKDDPHVQNCADALSQIQQQAPSFCTGNTSLSVAAVVKDEDFCKQAYYAGCWHETPFNSGCCASTCDASAGMVTCHHDQTKTQHDSEIHLNVTFKYDPDDDVCKTACNAISAKTVIWSDFCAGTSGAFDQNPDVKNCGAAMDSIHHQVNDVMKDWCSSSLTQQII